LVALYLDDEKLYDPKDYQVGNTVAILYALRKTFMDGQDGIRVEDGHAIRGTFPIASSTCLRYIMSGVVESGVP
jgi:hypothetical protein